MSGGFVNYSLRPNKAVDRQLFIDLLVRANRYLSIGDYTYISFGGTYFEDFKLMHSYFGNDEMISIEGDLTVYERQKFNSPHASIKLNHTKSNDFISSYTPDRNAIVWLDYASPSELKSQCNELEILIGKALLGDIIKITVNANPNTLLNSDSWNEEKGRRYFVNEINEKRLSILRERVGEILPNYATSDDFSRKRYPSLLNKMIGYVCSVAINNRGESEPIVFQPMTSFSYADSEHQMLTVTGTLLKKAEVNDFLNTTQLNRWSLASTDWTNSIAIAVPALTVKEKYFLDQLMPTLDYDMVKRNLGFSFVPLEKENKEIIESYMKLYRYYPSFQRVAI